MAFRVIEKLEESRIVADGYKTPYEAIAWIFYAVKRFGPRDYELQESDGDDWKPWIHEPTAP